MIQKDFANRVLEIVKSDNNVLGLAASGSWIDSELDQFSDLDLVLVTRERISGDPDLMKFYAARFGKLLNAFTGEHVGEPRLLVCLFDEPLLHVDIKFLTPQELSGRVEDPHILYDPESVLAASFDKEPAVWPFPGYQWIEDRFWIWLHYATTKLGRGEYFEALEFLSFIRTNVISPLLLIRNNRLPKGVRKVEFALSATDLEKLTSTTSAYDPQKIATAVWRQVSIYRELRDDLYPPAVLLQKDTEKRAVEYYQEIVGGAGK